MDFGIKLKNIWTRHISCDIFNIFLSRQRRFLFTRRENHKEHHEHTIGGESSDISDETDVSPDPFRVGSDETFDDGDINDDGLLDKDEFEQLLLGTPDEDVQQDNFEPPDDDQAMPEPPVDDLDMPEPPVDDQAMPEPLLMIKLCEPSVDVPGVSESPAADLAQTGGSNCTSHSHDERRQSGGNYDAYDASDYAAF